MKKKTLEQFINDSRKIHGNKYDYSKAEYINARTKVCIICPEHGEFWQKPSAHVRGVGCPKCKNEKISSSLKMTTSEFVEKAKQVHGNRYDYSKVRYERTDKKVCIICPEHGEFWQTPNHHLKGQGCPKCVIGQPNPNRLTAEEFINKAIQVHGNKYDYSKVNYVGNKTKVCIICPEHGEFWQTPNAHLSKQGCPKCVGHYSPTNEEFIERARKVHGDKYDYSKVNYIKSSEKVCIICPEHGEFWQAPSTHISQKCGCPVCKQSHLELEVRTYMENNNIIFEQQKMFNWLGLMRLDFYLPGCNTAIECQGIQHFEPIDFGGKGKKHAKKLFKDNKYRDKLKKELCEEHKIKMIYVNYNDNVEDVLKTELK